MKLSSAPPILKHVGPPPYTEDPANLENIANHFSLNLHNSNSFKSKVKDFATYMALEANSQGDFLLQHHSFVSL